jgi:hypothetical protein
MRISVSIRLLAITLLGTWTFASFAQASSRYFAKYVVLSDPQSHFQRGVVAWRDGVETLIVQSSVDGGGDELGWVLPLPAPPTAIAHCPTGSLNHLAGQLRPDIDLPDHKKREEIWIMLTFSLLMLAASVMNLARRSFAEQVMIRILLLFGGAFLLAVLFPSYRASSLAPAVELDILTESSAGIYDITILQGASGAVVEDWLTSNGFRASPEVLPVLNYYAQKKWCFAAAKVRRDSAGQAQHHPLRFVFPSDAPVYPLRLSGAGQASLTLDLFVIGSAKASIPGMAAWHSDSCDQRRYFGRVGSLAYVTVPPVFAGRTFETTLGQAGVADLMWPGCVITRLHDQLDSRELADDLTIQWKPAAPERAVVHPAKWAWVDSARYGALAASIAILVLAIPVARREQARKYKLACGGLVVAAAIGMGATVMARQSMSVVNTRFEVPDRLQNVQQDIRDDVFSRLRGGGDGNLFPQTYSAAVEAELSAYGNQPDSPALRSLFSEDKIEASSNGWRLTYLNGDYVPITMNFDANGTPLLRERPTSTPAVGTALPIGGN